MSLKQFQHRVASHAELESLTGSPSELAIRKQLTELDGHMQAFIAEAPFALLATYGKDGRCNASLRELPTKLQTQYQHKSHSVVEEFNCLKKTDVA